MKNKKLKKISGAGQTVITMAEGASVKSAKFVDNSKASRVDNGNIVRTRKITTDTLHFGGINLGGDDNEK